MNEKDQCGQSNNFLLPDSSYIFTCIHILYLFAIVKNSFSLEFQIQKETLSLETVRLLPSEEKRLQTSSELLTKFICSDLIGFNRSTAFSALHS